MDPKLIIISLLCEEEEKQHTVVKQNKKRKWVHEICKKRKIESEFATLFPQLVAHGENFFQYFRMSYEKFQELLSIIKPDLTKQNTTFRCSIPPAERLAVTLRFLATGDSFKTIAFSYRLGHTTVREIVHSTCNSIWKRLQPIEMPSPTEDLWRTIEKDFHQKWNFPNCLGAVDGKHVVIQAPPNSGSLHYNYKKTFSIVLMALVDANYKIIIADVGAYGKNSDGGIFSSSVMGKALINGTLSIPPNKTLPGTNITLPHVIVGDEAFPLHKHIMRPYPGTQIRHDEGKAIFNYRLSRARRLSENVFGILTQKFRIYQRRLQMSPEHIDYVILATCCLHNFLRGDSRTTEIDLGDNIETTHVSTIQNLRNVGGKATEEAFHIRDEFKNYFCTIGAVDWQKNMVRQGYRNQQ